MRKITRRPVVIALAEQDTPSGESTAVGVAGTFAYRSPPTKANPMRQHLLTALLVALGTLGALAQGVDYDANTVNPPYEGKFRPGVNLAYVPPWSNTQLADLAAGNPELGIPGIGARTTRPGLFDIVLDRFGFDLSVEDYEYYESLGMSELTAIVGFPNDPNRDYVNKYCNESVDFAEVKWNAHFQGIYEPIWDDPNDPDYDGTIVNEDNKYADYLYRVVSIYTDYVRFWEIWNEPGFYTGDDAQVFWGEPDYPGSWWVNDPDPCDYSLHAPIEHYVRVLRISYEVIKSISPDDYVSIAGVGSQSFLDAILRNTDNPGADDPYYGDAGLGIGVGEDGSITPEYPKLAGAYIDVLGFHTYPHFDGSTLFPPTGYFERHSDGAARGVIERRLGGYQEVLEKYGYDGVTYPKKQHIATEINVPRRIFTGEYFGGEQEQVNFIQKVLMELKIAGVHQMHVFTIGDREFESDSDGEFDLMGLYQKLAGVEPYNQVVNEEGVAYKTASDLIYPTEYDAARTAELAAPDGVVAYAWALPSGEYVYALWARTQTDLSEAASASYTFPAGLGLGRVLRHEWDYSRTGAVDTVDAGGGLTLELDATPVYIITAGEGSGPGDAAPSVTLSSETSAADGPFTVRAGFSEPVTGLTAEDFSVTNGVATALTGSGSAYTLTVTPAQVRGDIGISLPAGAAFDEQGEPSLASNALAIRNLTQDGPGPNPDPAVADLSLSLGADRDVVDRGENLTYTLTLTNAGPDAATGVAVDFALPDSLNFVAPALAGRGEYDPTGGRWTVGNVGARESLTLAVEVFANTQAERRAFAQVSASGVEDPNSTPANGSPGRANENDEAVYVINAGRTGGDGGVDNPDPTADLSLAAGPASPAFSAEGLTTLSITLANAGPDATTAVTVELALPVGVSVEDSNAPAGTQFGAGVWTVNSLAVGAAPTLTVTLRTAEPTRAATVRAQVISSSVADPDSAPANDAAGEDDDIAIVIGGSTSATTADVQLSARADRSTFYRGNLLDLTFAVTNTGEDAAEGLVVHAPMPVGGRYIGHEATAGSFRPLFDRWTVGTLAPGATASLTVTIRAMRADPAIVSFAQVVAQDNADADSEPDNRSCCTPVEDDEAVVRVRPAVVTGRPFKTLDDVELFFGRGAAPGSTSALPGDAVELGFSLDAVRQPSGGAAFGADFTTTLRGTTRGVLVDALGRTVRRLSLAEGPGAHRVELQANGLTPGTYTLLIERPDGSQEPVTFVLAR